MSIGLTALLDDVAGIAKVAAASIDDIAGHAAKASAKSAGVVIDDTAVTPRYVVGFSAERELPIVGKIALGSIRNKLLILLPIALILGEFAPWAITPLLMIGGVYLCYEGAEKVYEVCFPARAHEHEARVVAVVVDANELEQQKVAGAIRTDFILSAEIMAIALSTIPDAGLLASFVTLAVVAVAITAGVYGTVAIIVKADDLGVALAKRKDAFSGSVGRWIVRIMPRLLTLLTVIGTAAMIWVGGGIILHGLEVFGLGGPAGVAHDLEESVRIVSPVASAFAAWFVSALYAGTFGLLVGGIMIPIVSRAIVPIFHPPGA